MTASVLVSLLMATAVLQGGGTADSTQRLVLRMTVGQASARVTIANGGTVKLTHVIGQTRGVTASLDGDGVVFRLVVLSKDSVTGATSTVLMTEQCAVAG